MTFCYEIRHETGKISETYHASSKDNGLCLSLADLGFVKGGHNPKFRLNFPILGLILVGNLVKKGYLRNKMGERHMHSPLVSWFQGAEASIIS